MISSNNKIFIIHEHVLQMALLSVEDPVEGAAIVHAGLPVCVLDLPRGPLRGSADTL